EEVEDAGRTIPRSIMWSDYINGAIGFIMAITMCFCLGDLSKIVDTPTGYPFIQVFYNSTKSYAATNVMVSPTMHIPLRAVLASMSVTCLVSLINIGSTAALNAIVSLYVAALLSSYYISIGCLIWKRLKGEPLPPRRWSLGRYGLAVNVAALLFLTPIYFFAFWPQITPVEPQTMNWAVAIYGGVMVWSLLYYAIWGRHSYTGPVTIVKRNQ
ncbi:MAG: hypothetical protein Q9181_005925, partial [Wetmoreana brouardii]